MTASSLVIVQGPWYGVSFRPPWHAGVAAVRETPARRAVGAAGADLASRRGRLGARPEAAESAGGRAEDRQAHKAARAVSATMGVQISRSCFSLISGDTTPTRRRGGPSSATAPELGSPRISAKEKRRPDAIARQGSAGPNREQRADWSSARPRSGADAHRRPVTRRPRRPGRSRYAGPGPAVWGSLANARRPSVPGCRRRLEGGWCASRALAGLVRGLARRGDHLTGRVGDARVRVRDRKPAGRRGGMRARSSSSASCKRLKKMEFRLSRGDKPRAISMNRSSSIGFGDHAVEAGRRCRSRLPTAASAGLGKIHRSPTSNLGPRLRSARTARRG